MPIPLFNSLSQADINKLNSLRQNYDYTDNTVDAASITVPLTGGPVSGQTDWLRLTINGHDGSEAAGWNVNQLWLNDGGTMTGIGSVASGAPRSTAALATVTAVIQDDGAGGLECIVTGVLGQTIEWHLYWHYE